MKIQCKKCLDIIESLHRYDMTWCSCDSIFIDGGSDYTRIGYKEEEIIEYDESKFKRK